MNIAAAAPGLSMFIIEIGATLIATAVAICWPGLGSGYLSRAERFFGRLARRRGLAVLVVGAVALVIRLAILPLSPVPQPSIHDEFANLLAADTFASGRVTNPTHPMWTHFESFHITQRPTYMSMYFPAQGLVLAAGKVVTGYPWFGVLLSAALMCSAICWMLQAWLPPGWALLGGALAVVRLAMFSYWIDSYYGGAVAAIGGALVLGAFPRIIERARVRDWLWMALGMVILANSRPFEGLLLCTPVVGALFWKMAGGPSTVLLRRAAAPVALLVAAAGTMAWYNHRVFGDALTLPYQINRATYASSPVFIWQRPRTEPAYRYRTMRDFYTNWELRSFLYVRTPGGFVRGEVNKLGVVLFFFFGGLFMIPLTMIPRVLLDRRLRFLLWAGGIFALGLSTNAWLSPHYVAPYTCALYAILLQCMRHLRYWKLEGRNAGLALARILPVTCLILAGLRLFAGPLNLSIPRWSCMWSGTEPVGLPRARMLAELERQPGLQLALVRYSPAHIPLDDWVYNKADIDKSKVVWARESETGNSDDLLRYFRDRTVWVAEPDCDPPKLSHYLRKP